MKICWDNLEKLKYSHKTGKWVNKIGTYFKYIDACVVCGEPFLVEIHQKGTLCSNECLNAWRKGENNPRYGKHISENNKETIRRTHTGKKISEYQKMKVREAISGSKNHMWKGGVSKLDLALYDTYAPQLEWLESEKIRRDPNNHNILQVSCTYCGKFFTPTLTQVRHRLESIKNENEGERRFYCSDECKRSCPIFHQQKYYKFQEYDLRREVQPELRQLVFKRDDYICQKCNSSKPLHCHHIEGVQWEPLLSADIEMCITLCKNCHEKVHQIEGCFITDMRCPNEFKVSIVGGN